MIISGSSSEMSGMGEEVVYCHSRERLLEV